MPRAKAGDPSIERGKSQGEPKQSTRFSLLRLLPDIVNHPLKPHIFLFITFSVDTLLSRHS